MSDIAAVYDDTRKSIFELVRGLPPEQLETPVPATPGWTIRDVIAHLTGDAVYSIAGDLPLQFFESFGDESGVASLNDWTERMVSERKDNSLEELLAEWEKASALLIEMLRGERDTALPMFGERVLVTDIGVHHQDLLGALGRQEDREAPYVRIGLAGYVAMAGLRAGAAGLAPLGFVTPEKTYVAGSGEPAVSVQGTRWEFFRALSGRRGVEQVRAYPWRGDPEPYLHLFYPYGIRTEDLIEP